MCSELCKDFYVVYQLEMVAGEVESSRQLVVTFFFLVSPYQTIEISLGQLSGAPPHINYFLRRCYHDYCKYHGIEMKTVYTVYLYG